MNDIDTNDISGTFIYRADCGLDRFVNLHIDRRLVKLAATMKAKTKTERRRAAVRFISQELQVFIEALVHDIVENAPSMLGDTK
jgi:hypothetical protein